MKLVQLNRHLLKTSILIAICLAFLGALIYVFIDSVWIRIAVFSLCAALIIFLVYRATMREFILKQLRKVYDSPLFDNEPFLKKESGEMDFESSK